MNPAAAEIWHDHEAYILKLSTEKFALEMEKYETIIKIIAWLFEIQRKYETNI